MNYTVNADDDERPEAKGTLPVIKIFSPCKLLILLLLKIA